MLEAKIDKANPDLAAALARYDGAQAFFDETRSGLWPTLAVGAAATGNRQSDQVVIYGRVQQMATVSWQLHRVAIGGRRQRLLAAPASNNAR